MAADTQLSAGHHCATQRMPVSAPVCQNAVSALALGFLWSFSVRTVGVTGIDSRASSSLFLVLSHARRTRTATRGCLSLVSLCGALRVAGQRRAANQRTKHCVTNRPRLCLARLANHFKALCPQSPCSRSSEMSKHFGPDFCCWENARFLIDS